MFFALVVPHAQPTEGWAQDGVVDGDDGFEAGVLVVAEHDLFVFRLVNGLEKIHPESSSNS